MLTTPGRITAEIRRLCRKIGSLGEPTFLDVSPRADSVIDECFGDVRRQVSERGGSIQHGWMIWEWPGISVEGVFRAVWRKPDQQLLDVTFKEDGEEHILFAPDTKRIFEGRRIETFRMAVGRDPRIERWIELNNRFDKLVKRQANGAAFGTHIVVTGEAVALRQQANSLSLEIAQSREARRAG